MLESTNLSRENLSSEIGCRLDLWVNVIDLCVKGR